MSDRVSVSFSVSTNAPHRARSVSLPDRSHTAHTQEDLHLSEIKRTHSLSISSVTSNMSDDYQPFSKKYDYSPENIDLEKQLMITAGGDRAHVLCYLVKAFILLSVVLGCGILVFYAL